MVEIENNYENNRKRVNFINSIKNDFNQKNKDERLVATEKKKPYGILKKKEIETTSKKKKYEIEFEKQKLYANNRWKRFEVKENKFIDDNKSKYVNYKIRSTSSKRIEDDDNMNNKNDNIKKSISMTKIKSKHKHHRHHHYQHYKRPKRIISILKLDSFSIIKVD